MTETGGRGVVEPLNVSSLECSEVFCRPRVPFGLSCSELLFLVSGDPGFLSFVFSLVLGYVCLTGSFVQNPLLSTSYPVLCNFYPCPNLSPCPNCSLSVTILPSCPNLPPSSTLPPCPNLSLSALTSLPVLTSLRLSPSSLISISDYPLLFILRFSFSPLSLSLHTHPWCFHHDSVTEK